MLHRCDVPECVNPKHLFIGTPSDNMLDKVQKGRARGALPGASHHGAKLTERDVIEIRRLYADGGITQRALADQFGVHQVQIGNIVRGESWATEKHGPRRRSNGAPNTKLTDEQVRAIRARHATGNVSQRALAGEYGVSEGHMSNLLSGKTRATS